jgi:pyridoxal phosphate enzyme (YggS family)
MSIKDRLAEVRTRIARAAERASRDPAEITLVAVTKSAGPEQIRELLHLGVTDLGESRVQQLAHRAAQINEYHARRLASGDETIVPRVRWHMIGHLQRNKLKQAVGAMNILHSLDTLRLADELEAHLEKAQTKSQTPVRLPVLIQVNAAEEPQKYGVAVGAVSHLAEQIATMKHVVVAGLMCMAPHGADESTTRFVFGRVREIFDEMKFRKIAGPSFKHLSMGMSDDFESAILEGSTMVRVGSAITGATESSEEDEE